MGDHQPSIKQRKVAVNSIYGIYRWYVKRLLLLVLALIVVTATRRVLGQNFEIFFEIFYLAWGLLTLSFMLTAHLFYSR